MTVFILLFGTLACCSTRTCVPSCARPWGVSLWVYVRWAGSVGCSSGSAVPQEATGRRTDPRVRTYPQGVRPRGFPFLVPRSKPFFRCASRRAAMLIMAYLPTGFGFSPRVGWALIRGCVESVACPDLWGTENCALFARTPCTPQKSPGKLPVPVRRAGVRKFTESLT